MPFFDWLEAGGVRPEWFSGSFDVKIGDVLSGTFGARHTHVFGPEIKIVCDPEDLLMGRLETYMPLVAGLLSGVGGNATWVYGANTSATYVGPKMDIRRAKVINKTSENVLARKTNEAGEEVIDYATSVAVGALSVLMCATGAALDLAIRFMYEEMEGTKDKGKKEHYEEVIESLKIASYTVTGRLMALLKTLEEKGSWAEFAKQWGKEGAFVGLLAANAVLGVLFPYGWAALILLYEEHNLKQVIKDAAAALGEE